MSPLALGSVPRSEVTHQGPGFQPLVSGLEQDRLPRFHLGLPETPLCVGDLEGEVPLMVCVDAAELQTAVCR